MTKPILVLILSIITSSFSFTAQAQTLQARNDDDQWVIGKRALQAIAGCYHR